MLDFAAILVPNLVQNGSKPYAALQQAGFASHAGQTKKALAKLMTSACFYPGTPDRIRTCDPLIRSQVLYPAELLVH